MTDFRIGYMYSLAPIHCGGEGDLGNILEIAREAHTNFPYAPGSSVRGSLRDEVASVQPKSQMVDDLFGKELDSNGQMGVHQVWFGDARLLWVPMRTMSMSGGKDVFTWVSCHSLIRDHALLAQLNYESFPDYAVGTVASGTYTVADADIQVSGLLPQQRNAIALSGNWHSNLASAVQPTWNNKRIVLPDADFEVLMEHSLWTQVRNKIQETENGATQPGSAEVFWTDVCIPRDTIFYYPWGYSLSKTKPITSRHHNVLMDVLKSLFQVGGQANVGRGWVQGWVADETPPTGLETPEHQAETMASDTTESSEESTATEQTKATVEV
ncbi:MULTISPECIES: RAMP superfamily CRISPR-associated protein [unclassified Coleofasciculus]|uniref:RAMP superfamily CRISPR-associated protein n=1 Tax=unclassified Coleofasciculus TaxID=2692782 RepID=UPI0018829595|nr:MULTISPECIES: RAMP superfamily CRISPR-associated protein [unclassified Coleofasciculus]MBE9129431.1 type III-B CRISPR module RAMP protein Cmr4 [Coleofasciculus sp. LEGE 07081]MBE9152159.1 type III-B CRISPR module RAMP protein Cmr4 [Coleofasciculus sp. LEGE 07092]